MGPSRRPSARRRTRLRKSRHGTSRPWSRRPGKTRLRRFGWRWRRNALRRRTDLVEAWLGVLTALLFCLAPVVGWWAGQSVDRTLQGVVRAQRSARTLVTATVLPLVASQDGAGGPSTGAPAGKSVSRAISKATPVGNGQHGDLLRWKAPDGSTHTRQVTADLEVLASGRVQLWTDRRGDLVPPPLDSATASTHAVLSGIAVGATAGGVLLVSRSLLMWRLMRRRMDSWEREWARVGQDWGRAGAGG